VAIDHMEALEAEAGIRSVAYEMLGPPRLSKLLFEAEILLRLEDTVEAAAGLDPEDVAARALALVRDDADLRQRALSIGIPVILPDGKHLLRGPHVIVGPEKGLSLGDPRLPERGWVDLRAENWARWRERCRDLAHELRERPGVAFGSGGDHEYGDLRGKIRPGRMAAWIFRYEDKGERIKR